MPFEGQPIHLTDAQRSDLEEVTRSRALPAEFVQRAKVVLLLADGVSARTVATKGQSKNNFRFSLHGFDGLRDPLIL